MLVCAPLLIAQTGMNPPRSQVQYTQLYTEGMTIGMHGYPADDPDMNAIFIAWGRGIRKGARVGLIRNVDVAPTAAALLGLKLEGVDGKALSEILE